MTQPCTGTHSQVRRNFIEADAAVALHVLFGVDFQFLVGVHRHQHRANVGLKKRTKSREVTGGLEAELRCLWRLGTCPGVLGVLLRAPKQAKGVRNRALSSGRETLLELCQPCYPCWLNSTCKWF